MDDAYRALCVATRRPMRQWWRRVGSWWIAALVVLLGAVVWTIVHDYQWMQLAKQKVYTPITLFRDIIGTLDFLINPLASFLWLLAALKANDLITRLASETASVGEGELRFLRFRLALAQGAIPVIALLLYYLMNDVKHSTLGLGDQFDVANVLMWPGTLASALYSITFMLWMFLFLASIQIKRWFVVGWCMVIYCLPWLYYFIHLLGAYLSFSIYPNSEVPIALELDPLQKVFIWLCALAYFYSIPWLLAQHRVRPAIWLGAVFLVIAPLNYVPFAAGSILFSLIRAIGQNMYYAITPIVLWAESLSIEGSGFAAVCDVNGNMLGWQTSFPLPVALTFLLLIVPIATFVAHYYALRWIMLNVKPAAPKQKQPGPEQP